MYEEEDGNIVEMTSISKSFPGVLALNGVDFSLRRKEVHGLVGENGAGKSTLMKILSGVYIQDLGEIKYRGDSIRLKDARDAQKLGIALVYQEPQIVPEISIAENICMGMFPQKYGFFVDKQKMNNISAELALKVGLTKNVSLKASSLSMGERQMAQIAKALYRTSSVVIMDEPTSSLTKREKESLFSVIRTLKKDGISIIYISHRMDEIFEICDRVTVLKDGQLVKTLDIHELDKKGIVNLMVGRELGLKFPEKSGKFGKEILRVENLTQDGVFENVSFCVRAGEVLGFGGLIGAGRTEVMDVIFGRTRPSSGNIYINGGKVNIRSPKDAISNKIAYATEDRHAGLILHASILENTTLASLRAFVRRIFIGEKKRRQRTNEFKNLLSIKAASIMANVGNLSGGNQQKVIFAKWLMKDADIYVLDEPTRGIDVGAKEEIYKLIKNLVDNEKAVIVISSELPELIGISDRILVIHNGRITGELSGSDITESSIIQYATGVMSA